jgi:hypothetical protein
MVLDSLKGINIVKVTSLGPYVTIALKQRKEQRNGA